MIWTVNRLKEKQEASKSESPKAVVEPSAEIKTVIVAKKTIWEKFVHECKHYYRQVTHIPSLFNTLYIPDLTPYHAYMHT